MDRHCYRSANSSVGTLVEKTLQKAGAAVAFRKGNA